MSEDNRTEVRVLYDFKDDAGEEYKAGQFLLIAPAYADQLVAEKVVEKKTREDVEREETDKLADEASKRRMAGVHGQRGIERITAKVSVDPNTGGFRNFGEMCKDVKAASSLGNRHVSEKLARWSAHCLDVTTKTNAVTYDDSQGGYLVPPSYLAMLDANVLESTVAYQRCRRIPMETNRVNIPAVVDADHSSNFFGGITLYRTGEDETKVASKPLFRQIELTAHKITGVVNISDELLEDSPATVGAIMTDFFTQAIGFTYDEDVLNGTGINQALGVTASPALIAVPIVAAQPANTIWVQNIVDMWSRLWAPGQKNAVWLCNHGCLPELYTMGLAVGAGGSSVFMPAGGVSSQPYASLMGRPLIPTEKLPALSTANDIMLIDFSQYVVANKGGIKTAVSEHIFFLFDRQCFRFVFRGDGQPLWNAALQPLNGPTVSPFIGLAGRP